MATKISSTYNIIQEALWALSGYHLDALTVYNDLKAHGINDFHPKFESIKEAVDNLASRQSKMTHKDAHKLALQRIAYDTGISRDAAEYCYQQNNILVNPSNKYYSRINNDKLYDYLTSYLRNNIA